MRTTLALLLLLAAGLLAPYIHRTPRRIDYKDIRTDASAQLCKGKINGVPPEAQGDERFVEKTDPEGIQIAAIAIK